MEENKPQRPPEPTLRGFKMFQKVIAPDGSIGVVLDLFTDNTALVGFWNVPLRVGLETIDAEKGIYPLDALEICGVVGDGGMGES